MKHPVILWFRNDLRLGNNSSLNSAMASNRPVVPVYIFEEKYLSDTGLGFSRTETNRLTHWFNTIHELKSQIEASGGKLLIYRGDTVEILTGIYRKMNCNAIYAQHEYAPEEVAIENQLKKQVNLILNWDNLLFLPSEVNFTAAQSPFYYTAFRTKALSNHLRHEKAIQPFMRWYLAGEDHSTNDPTQEFPIPSQQFHHPAGEVNALRHWEIYLQMDYLKDYQKTREYFHGDHFSTLLSPYLSQGNLSVRKIYSDLVSQESTIHPPMASIQKLKDQLIWRDYYRWLFLRYGTRIFRRTGLRTQVREMFNDMEAFHQWKNGCTGQPLIDALMKQLHTTGIMSNRGRMLAAYYLSKEMKVNWLWGALWFESQLIDYDVCNNYGNWAYQSGTGTDSRINRKFNLQKQQQKFDPDGTFVSYWQNYPLSDQ